MRGLVLAGGTGSRLRPATFALSKQLLSVYDKPMIYYPLCVHLLAGIRDLLIVSTPTDTPQFQRLLGDGSQWGVNICYAVQPAADGTAQALLTACEFIGNNNCSVALGDNIFYGRDLSDLVQNAATLKRGARVFACAVQHPERYGVVTFDDQGKAFDLQEKPDKPKSGYAVTGLYYYDSTACSRVRDLRPSARGELEITDLNRAYLDDEKLSVEVMPQSMVWLDMGDHDSLMEAANFIQTTEKKQGVKVCCPEEISWRMGNINDEQLENIAQSMKNNAYGRYLYKLLDRNH